MGGWRFGHHLTGDHASCCKSLLLISSPSSPRNFKGYEEVHVPAAPKAPPPGEDELVKISDLDEWAQVERGAGVLWGFPVHGMGAR